MEYKIRGTTLQVLDMQLEEGEGIFTEAGGMAWMTPNITMNSNMKGGIFGGLGRIFSGESLFIVDYTCNSGTGLISFCNEFPGKIVTFNLNAGESIVCQRDAFMLATKGVDLKMEFVKKIGAGIFGGEGFFLQKLTGPGTAFLEIAGEVTEYELEEGQTLEIDPGYIGAFQSSVKYDIVKISGIKNMLFGGEGIFLAALSGPGKIWLQSMPLVNLASRIATKIPKR